MSGSEFTNDDFTPPDGSGWNLMVTGVFGLKLTADRAWQERVWLRGEDAPSYVSPVDVFYYTFADPDRPVAVFAPFLDALGCPSGPEREQLLRRLQAIADYTPPLNPRGFVDEAALMHDPAWRTINEHAVEALATLRSLCERGGVAPESLYF